MELKELVVRTRNVAESEEIKIISRIKPSYFTRERKMTFRDLVYYILHPGKESTQLGLHRFFGLLGRREQAMSEQAFSKARGHFNHLPFETMVRETTELQYSGEEKTARWQGRYLFAVDGTTLALPDKPSLCKKFGASGRKKDSATANVSLLYDIENDWIADAAIEPYPTSEKMMALSHLDRLVELGIAKESLVLFDRGYPEEKLISRLTGDEIGFLMRCRRKFNPVADETLSNDFTMLLKGKVPVRVIKLTLPTGETELLLTNLFELPYEEFQALYFKRWPIETKYDILKNKLELGNFTGYSPNAILQDFWTCIHLANIVATARAEANALLQTKQKNSQNLHCYVPNTAQLVGSLKDHFIKICFLHNTARRNRAIDSMVAEISRAVSPIRPGRSFWRNPWPRKAKFCFNAKSNI